MAHTFQIKDKTYVAVGSAYNLFVASKKPFSLPGLPGEAPIDLMALSSIEDALAAKYRDNETLNFGNIPAWPEYERLVKNPVLAFHALYYLCHENQDEAERIAFIRSIDNESCDAAMQALIGAVADFFDSQTRPLTACALRTSVETAKILATETRESLKTALTPEAVVKEFKRQAGGGLSSSSEQSIATPETYGSKPAKALKSSSGMPRDETDSSSISPISRHGI